MNLIRIACALAVVLLAGGCGEETGPPATCDEIKNDPRKVGAANGQRLSATDACAKLKGAFDDHVQQQQCIKTTPECPGFMASVDPYYSATKPREYDAGSLQWCIEHFKSFSTCQTLTYDECVVKSYPEPCSGE